MSLPAEPLPITTLYERRRSWSLPRDGKESSQAIGYTFPARWGERGEEPTSPRVRAAVEGERPPAGAQEAE